MMNQSDLVSLGSAISVSTTANAAPLHSFFFFFFFFTFRLSHQLFARQDELSFQKYHRSGKEVQGEES